jgi:predicted anti-sigma-YlaC factor YlaD
MKRMNHGITPNEWERHLDGSLPIEDQDRIEAHLIGCLPCWEFHQRMATLHAQLQTAGEAKRDQFALSDEKLRDGLRNVYARIHAHHTNANVNSVQQRLNELEALMTVFCGTQTAMKAMQAAAQQSPAKKLPRVSQENWEAFLKRLTAIAHVLFGNTGARLVFESGRL